MPPAPRIPASQISHNKIITLHNSDDPDVLRRIREEPGYYSEGIWFPSLKPGTYRGQDGIISNIEPERRPRGRPRKEKNAAVVLNAPMGSPLPSKRELARKGEEKDKTLKMTASKVISNLQ